MNNNIFVLFLLCFIVEIVFISGDLNVCETTSRDLYTQELLVYEKKLQCEHSEFRSSDCSAYLLHQYKLSRGKLNYQLCQDEKYAPYYDYTGTFSNPEGVFYKHQLVFATSLNHTASSLQKDILASLSQLRESAFSLASNTRANITTLLETLWLSTRETGSQDEQSSRQLILNEIEAIQQLVKSEENNNRETYMTESESTRTHHTKEENNIREHADGQHSRSRSFFSFHESTSRDLVGSSTQQEQQLWESETTSTETTVQSNFTSESQLTSENARVEYGFARSLVSEAGPETQGVVSQQESTTVTEITQLHKIQTESSKSAINLDATQAASLTASNEVKSSILSSESEVSSSWSSSMQTILPLSPISDLSPLVVASLASISSISANIFDFANNLTEFETKTIMNLMFHVNLQVSPDYSLFASNPYLMDQLSYIELFQRPSATGGYFEDVRAVTLETINYNNAKYPYSSKAVRYWNEGEGYKNARDYRSAVYYYRLAYKAAVCG